jgi:hypothetical protein
LQKYDFILKKHTADNIIYHKFTAQNAAFLPIARALHFTQHTITLHVTNATARNNAIKMQRKKLGWYLLPD